MSVKLTPKLKEAIAEMRDDYNQRVDAFQKELKSPDFEKFFDSAEYKERTWKEYLELVDLGKFIMIFTKEEKKDDPT